MSTAVFRFPVVLFPLFGLAIFSLCFALPSTLSLTTALITAVSLSSEAAATDTKIKLTPSALN